MFRRSRRGFAPGTLERSIRRWGPRFPRPGFKRKNFGNIYAHLTGTDLDVPVNGDVFEVNLFDSSDWNAAGNVGTNLVVRNVSVDMHWGLVGLPVTSGNVISETNLRWGIFLVDEDDVFGGLDDYFAQYRAIRWGIEPFIANSRTTSSAAASTNVIEQGIKLRTKFRCSKIQETQMLVYAARLDLSITGSWTDATHPLATRVSYELL